MHKTIDVFLITGFLGSGKTACLNHFIKNAPQDLNVMVIMNEFGAYGIDGHLLEIGDVNILEINKGSIFCACAKTDFIRALSEIAVNFRPDVLFIEASGAANPLDMRRDLELPFFKGAFRFQKQLCLVDLSNFIQEAEVFTAAAAQVKAADICVLNKSDLSSPKQAALVKKAVLQHNPNVVFEETTFGRVDLTPFYRKNADDAAGAYPMCEKVTEKELKAVLNGMLCDLNANLTPPDNLVSAVYRWNGESVDEFTAMLERWPKAIVRAKALLKFGNGAKIRFDWVLGQHTYDKYVPDNNLHKNYDNLWNYIVLLANPAVMRELEQTTAIAELKLTKMAE